MSFLQYPSSSGFKETAPRTFYGSFFLIKQTCQILLIVFNGPRRTDNQEIFVLHTQHLSKLQYTQYKKCCESVVGTPVVAGSSAAVPVTAVILIFAGIPSDAGDAVRLCCCWRLCFFPAEADIHHALVVDVYASDVACLCYCLLIFSMLASLLVMRHVPAVADVSALSLLAAGILYAIIVGVFAGVAAILAEVMSLLLMLGPVSPLNN
jgi:hypothetical protein